MKLSDFNYNLPKNQIAKYPISPRDKAKLLVVHKDTGEMEDKHFYDIIDYMNEGDVVVVNETKVFQARLFGKKEKTNAKIEVFLLRELNKNDYIWDVIVDPARKVRIGNKIYFSDSLWCEIIDNTTSRGRTVRFNQPNVFELVEKIGYTPLPPYIKRDPEPSDKENYQTVYAKVPGSVAAPTAGLHFTDKLIQKIQKKGIKFVPVILHIGLGTFRPVDVEDLSKHRMDSEYYEIPPSSAEVINEAIKNNKNVFIVGTSTCRALETSTTAEGFIKPNKGWTDKFIYPPYQFKVTKKLITNFHAPESTLILLVAALLGTDLTMKAYKKAVKDKYRFLSYGDAMLIL
ncbi:MAG: tRNA preQ1(34) S-adenosylmethionine ribosyltransferase-isomerase QueA [Ignavibacterium sp.]|nr:tRNA preQ1(34) S-adenosylmethionine ribosyltransferase-isomerase QueA [Ignavibacterium sp.]MDW8374806.1 tRNA preQ1(34) S-adenosylmethionine ribosyltransferase-isomerase QueA [Ignavibacteriales bacterium]